MNPGFDLPRNDAQRRSGGPLNAVPGGLGRRWLTRNVFALGALTGAKFAPSKR